MIPIITADGTAERTRLAAMQSRAGETGERITRTARAIMDDVKEKGFTAVEEYSRSFDGVSPREIPKDEWAAAANACPRELTAALARAAANIRAYNERLRMESAEWTSPDGGTVGRIVRPLGRVGLYVPGGTAAYPSSVLMTAIPARVAGVREVVMVTPPTEHLNRAVLAAAQLAGVDRIFAVGGVQAVAALTYGAGDIPRVDKLVGPGNAYVAAAKRMAFGTVDIDMIAGPSEVLIIADETANPVHVAADLLSQAEHDPLASAVLLTTSAPLAEAVGGELTRQLALLARRDIAEAALRDFGCAIVCQSVEAAAALANELAPEHLEIITKHPRAVLPLIENAGAIFLGGWSPEPLGDYMAGPNHVLPTAGTARFFSPLSVTSFLKTMSVIEYDRPAFRTAAADIITLAEAEGLAAHANAIRVRLEKE